MGLRSVGMGGLSVALTDAASALANTAALSQQQGTLVAISYRQDYLLSGTAHKWIAAAHSMSATGTATASYHHYGDPNYSEQKLSLGYAQLVSQHISLGATLDYLYSGVSDVHYSTLHGLTFSASLQATIGRQWTIGSQIFNPIALRIGSQQRIPALLAVGAAYKPAPEWTTSVEVQKSLYSPVSFHWGAEYTFLQHFAARAGFATQPVRYAFGIGFHQTHYSINIAVEVHQHIGLTTAIGGSLVL